MVLSKKVQARRGRGAFFASCDGAHVPPKLHHAHALWKEVIHALAGHEDPQSMEVYTRVFALELAATIAVPFTGNGRDAVDILRSLPPDK